MKHFIFVTLLFLGLLAGDAASAQQYVGPRTAKKDWKMHKKEGKINKKMFRDRPRQARRKVQKARKKYYKMEAKDERYK